MQQVLVIGNSHTKAISDVLLNVSLPSNVVVRTLWLKTERHGSVSLEDALSACRSLRSDDLVVLSYLGALHNHLTLFEHDRPFFVFGSNESCHDLSARDVVPVGTIRAYILSQLGKDATTHAFRSASPCPVLHFGSPPPRRENLRQVKRIRHEDGNVTIHKFADPVLRLAVWQIEAEAIASHLAARDIGYLPPPTDALDEVGYLKRTYWASDATHANEAYGLLVLQQILVCLGHSSILEG